MATGAGVAIFGYAVLYTAITASPPSLATTEPVAAQPSPSHVRCSELIPAVWEADQQLHESSTGQLLGQCTVAGRPPRGAAIEPVSACDAIGGHVTAWKEGDYPTLIENRPPLPTGQQILTVTDKDMQLVMELGIVYPNQTFALCGPLEWTYQHVGEPISQHIPSDAELGKLPEGRYYAYERTPKGNLELIGVGNRHNYVEPLPEGFPLPASLVTES
ncbi:hypothetical protein [Arthrobacter burdickii]|uniref:Uncharacterized protein n=1 Tax=Arthrobacter burdickii TaxID=3035920 RepID=A0ABT8JX05_9MICC|nr:hypothetical protein [Arthrobacter burdickii]MDN4609604.1 hypothetical protein [Arthrobacter burdickii]